MSLTYYPLPSCWHGAQYGVACNVYLYLLFPVSRVLALHYLILLSVLKPCSFPAYCRCLALQTYPEETSLSIFSSPFKSVPIRPREAGPPSCPAR
eukprot:69078-Pyramimonas_sp.AAC.1